MIEDNGNNAIINYKHICFGVYMCIFMLDNIAKIKINKQHGNIFI